MNDCVQEIENYLDRLDELQNEANHVLARLKRAELAGEYETCQICKRKWQMVSMTRRFMCNQLEQYIMFRLPPKAKRF